MNDEILNGAKEIMAFMKIKDPRSFRAHYKNGLPIIRSGKRISSTKLLILRWITEKRS